MRKFRIKRRPTEVEVRFREELNEQQFAAVTAGDGPKLVIAGAGSGKTRTITYRVAYLIARRVPPENIMLATFTNKAAREMIVRVESLVGGEVKKIWGGTFHSIANRVLRRNAKLLGYENNYSIIDEEDQRDMIKLCITDVGIEIKKKRFPSAAVVQDIISFAFNTERSIESVLKECYPQFVEWEAEIEKIRAKYQERKRRSNAMDYDDLLGNWLALLATDAQVLARYGKTFRHILVDEYQDTNKIQADIVETLAKANGYNLMVVGDDCQSIYAFRGANYENILDFTKRIPDTEIFKLETNYRSTPEILDFTNASIEHNEKQYKKVLKTHRESGVVPAILATRDVYEEGQFIAERVLELRDEGIPLGDIGVLYRAHSHSAILQAELIRRNIPYEVRSGVRFFEQAHIKDVVAYLKIFENEMDEIAWRRLLLTIPKVGNVTAQRIWQSLSASESPTKSAMSKGFDMKLPPMVKKFWEPFASGLRGISEEIKKGEPAEVVEKILDTNYVDYLKAKYDRSASRMEDIEQLAVLARQYKTVRQFISDLVLMGELYGQDVLQGDIEDEKLILSSVHQAKGLEWQHVFIIRMAEGSFPSPRALRETEGEEEERRIFYVAITRARDELYITYPLTAIGHQSNVIMQPSRFLLEIDTNLYEEAQLEEDE